MCIRDRFLGADGARGSQRDLTGVVEARRFALLDADYSKGLTKDELKWTTKFQKALKNGDARVLVRERSVAEKGIKQWETRRKRQKGSKPDAEESSVLQELSRSNAEEQRSRCMLTRIENSLKKYAMLKPSNQAKRIRLSAPIMMCTH